MSFDEDFEKYDAYAVRPNRQLVKLDIKSVNSYCHHSYEAHHFIPKSIRKINPELYARIEYLQRFFILPKNHMTKNGVINIHNSVHSCSESFDYNGFKWYDLLFSRRKWKEGYYDGKSAS